MGWNSDLTLRPLLHLEATLDEPIDVGLGPFGVRKILAVKEGAFYFREESGLGGITGTVHQCSADFSTRGSDNHSMLIDVRSLLQVGKSGGAYIYAQYASRVVLDMQMIDIIEDGQTISLEQSSFIVAPRFEVGMPEDASREVSDRVKQLERLNTAVVVGHAALSKRKIEYEMYEIINRNTP